MASPKATTKKSSTTSNDKLKEIKKGVAAVKKKTAKKTAKKSTSSKAVAVRKPEDMVDEIVFSPLTHRREASLIAQACSVLHFAVPREKKTKKQKAKGGRPTKMSERTLKKLEYAFAFDSTVEEACILAGITPVTYYAFIKKYPEFLNTVTLLRNIPMALARQVLVTGAMASFDNALKYAAVKKKNEFSPKIELSANTTETLEVSPEAKETVDKVFAMFERKASTDKADYVVIESDV